MNFKSISLIAFGHFDYNLIEKTAFAVEKEFNMPVMTMEGHLDLSEYYDATRRQYDATRLLNEIDSMVIQDSLKKMGILNVDLYIPILTFIFGQAYLNGNSGIASMYRLSNERYGMNPDDKLLLDRLTKEVIHELGHTFGLVHCHTPACVMRSSTYVEYIDQKEAHFCMKCRAQLGKEINPGLSDSDLTNP